MNVSLKRNLSYHGRVIAGLLAVIWLGLLLATQACTPSSQAVSGDQQETTVGINVGEVAPDFTLTDLEGNEVTLSEYRGKVVFINFWATWCPACRAEMPEMEAIYQEYKDKGVVVIGVDIQEAKEEVLQYVQQGGYSWTFLLDTSGAVAANYRVVAIPTSFFLDREGIIKAVNVGAMTKRAMEAKLIEAMR